MLCTINVYTHFCRNQNIVYSLLLLILSYQRARLPTTQGIRTTVKKNTAPRVAKSVGCDVLLLRQVNNNRRWYRDNYHLPVLCVPINIFPHMVITNNCRWTSARKQSVYTAVVTSSRFLLIRQPHGESRMYSYGHILNAYLPCQYFPPVNLSYDLQIKLKYKYLKTTSLLTRAHKYKYICMITRNTTHTYLDHRSAYNPTGFFAHRFFFFI